MSDVLDLESTPVTVPAVVGHLEAECGNVLFTEIRLRRADPEAAASLYFSLRKWGEDSNHVVVVATNTVQSHTIADVDAVTTANNTEENNLIALLNGLTIGEQLLLMQVAMEQVAFNIAVDEGLIDPPPS